MFPLYGFSLPDRVIPTEAQRSGGICLSSQGASPSPSQKERQ